MWRLVRRGQHPATNARISQDVEWNIDAFATGVHRPPYPMINTLLKTKNIIILQLFVIFFPLF